MSGAELGALAHLVEQLWAPAIATGDLRLEVGRGPTPGWTDVETYQALPSVTAATMLLPTADRRVLAGSLLNFRGLRDPRTRAQRRVLGSVVAGGLPLPFPHVRLQARSGAGRVPLPTEQVAVDLGLPRVHASIGVRTGSNRKATLQLVDDDGAAVGFAKFAWDEASTTAVATEAAALHALGGGVDGVRAPRLLARGTWLGRPYLVTEPLPAASRRPAAGALPSAEELFALCPVVRRDLVARSGQFQGLRDRIDGLRAAGVDAELVDALDDLLDRLADTEVPVAARWHGDLTAWNTARDEQDRLWCWDWESTEADAVAGLDAVHWVAGGATMTGARYDGALLAAALRQAGPALTAAGHSRASAAVVPLLYVASLVERAVALAVGNGRWDDAWLRRDEAVALVAHARALAPERTGADVRG
ncbi:hypothetical protein [Nocardioides nitrophenolicus]|uniref:hypothetical protein n=1 Tax=Nocardioides nitrophenolicus TaxID=60489 RepID=UPI00195847EC|nr:hypothetical protein [Nocardioides nitrophenolicus]MBM7520293.1 hypothetical protein [Nocardioides nitrophenolicus]